MGLDVFAYSNVKCISDGILHGEPIDPITGDVFEDYPEGVITHVNSRYFKQADDIKNNEYYIYVDEVNFWSSGYGGYSEWIEGLAKFAGYSPIYYESVKGNKSSGFMSYTEGACQTSDGPFVELINFTDYDALIGTQTSQKLLKDFEKFNDIAKNQSSVFYMNYSKWIFGLKIASNNGFLIFR